MIDKKTFLFILISLLLSIYSVGCTGTVVSETKTDGPDVGDAIVADIKSGKDIRDVVALAILDGADAEKVKASAILAGGDIGIVDKAVRDAMDTMGVKAVRERLKGLKARAIQSEGVK